MFYYQYHYFHQMFAFDEEMGFSKENKQKLAKTYLEIKHDNFEC